MPKLLHYLPNSPHYGLSYKLAGIYEIPELEFCPAQATEAGLAVEVDILGIGPCVGRFEKRGEHIAVFYDRGTLTGPVVPFRNHMAELLN